MRSGGGPHRVMAARWPRVHLYRSPGPVTKESCCRRRRPLPKVRPGAEESQCRSPTRCSGKPKGLAAWGVGGLGSSVGQWSKPRGCGWDSGPGTGQAPGGDREGVALGRARGSAAGEGFLPPGPLCGRPERSSVYPLLLGVLERRRLLGRPPSGDGAAKGIQVGGTQFWRGPDAGRWEGWLL